MPVVDQLFADYKYPEDLLGGQGLPKQSTKKLAERALETEMEQHLGYVKHGGAGKNTGNFRNEKAIKRFVAFIVTLILKLHVTVMAALNLSC